MVGAYRLGCLILWACISILLKEFIPAYEIGSYPDYYPILSLKFDFSGYNCHINLML